MSLIAMLHKGWVRMLEILMPDHQQRLWVLLRRQYAEAMCTVAQLTQHAQRMHYPQFCEQLVQIANEKQAHVRWLQEKILALGGDLPVVSCTPPMGKNSWECLRLAVDTEKRSCTELLACIHQADRTDPEMAEELRSMRKEKQRHQEALVNMLMKSDPYALPPLLTRHEEQWEDWLTQERIRWLDNRQAEWEAAGKPMPWAQWVGEREVEWVVNELPNRELEWVQGQAERETA